MRFRCLAALLVTIAAVPACSTAFAADDSESLTAGGVTRTYELHVPPKHAQLMPLVLAFHGHGGTGAGEARLSGLDALADRFGFVVVYPDGIDRGWNDGRTPGDPRDDLGFVKALIAELSRKYAIDANRVYATGMSNGAVFSQYLGCTLADSIAAIASVAGSMPVAEAPRCRPGRAISVLQIAGTDDPIMPYAGGEIRFGRLARGKVLSVDTTAAFWSENAGCARNPATSVLAPIGPPDGTSIELAAYTGCRDGTAVERYAVRGGGHAWPGGVQYLPSFLIGRTSRQLDASLTIVNFFYAHPMRDAANRRQEHPGAARTGNSETRSGTAPPS